MTTRPPTSHIAPFGLRMQPRLRARLEEAAQQAGRSLNAEIVERLEASFVPDMNTLVSRQRYDELKREILEYVLESLPSKRKADK